MTDWFYENERKGIVKDMGREIGGASLPLELSFISTHPDSYKQLKNHPERVRRMADKEKEINLRPHYYVPKQEIEKCSSGIKNGDILFYQGAGRDACRDCLLEGWTTDIYPCLFFR